MKKYLFVFLLIFGCCFAGEIRISEDVGNDTYVVGSLVGEFSVEHTGAANYSIPIKEPLGTAEIVPALSIHYDSQHPNGLMGVGFSLQGLTAITRGPSNMAQNGVRHAVDYSYDDVFYLNGQQLVAISGIYGQDQTEYRTYSDSFVKVISYGQQGNGPEKFKVWTKGGQIAEYAYTDDSQVLAQGQETVAIWALNKISDTYGNYLTIEYTQNADNGTYYPAEIKYTANDNASLSPYNSIKFNYETRSDAQISYTGGSIVKLDQRLKSIEIYSNYSGNKLLYTYDFTYEQSPTLNSRLISIQKSDCNGKSFPPTKFEWSGTSDDQGWLQYDDYKLPRSISDTFLNDQNKWVLKAPRSTFADLTGNGKPDFVTSFLQRNKTGGDTYEENYAWFNLEDKWQLYKNYTLPSYIFNSIPCDNPCYIYNNERSSLVDINGDGLPDYVESYNDDFSGDHEHVWLNNKNGWVPYESYTLPVPKSEVMHKTSTPTHYICPTCTNMPYMSERGFFVDLNGNGLADYVASYFRVNIQPPETEEKTWLNTGNGWSLNDNYKLPDPRVLFTTLYDCTYAENYVVGFFADFNGDGLQDYIESYDDGYGLIANRLYLNTGEGWLRNESYLLPFPIVRFNGSETNRQVYHRGHLVDLNGDGLLDYVFSYEDEVGGESRAWLNTGTGWIEYDDFAPPIRVMTTTPDGKNMLQQGFFVDLNGNGRPDYIASVDGSGSTKFNKNKVWLNTGSGWISNDNYLLPLARERIKYDNTAVTTGFFIDLNGNCMNDYVFSFRNYNNKTEAEYAYLNKMPKPDLLTAITDGLGCRTEITYSPLSDESVYMKDDDGEYPDIDVTPPMYVVSQTSSDTDVFDSEMDSEVQHITNYQYVGMKINKEKWGSLGFRQVIVTDESTGISTTTTYSQTPSMHNVGAMLNKTTMANGNLLSLEEVVWNLKIFGSGKVNETYYLPYTEGTMTMAWSLQGSLISKTIIDMAIDDYGNPTAIEETVTDADGNVYSTTTKNTYNIDETNWFLCQLVKAEVTSSVPGQDSVTRTSSFAYDAESLLSQEVIEPDDSDYTLTVQYSHDSFGNVIQKKTLGLGVQSQISTFTYDDFGRFVIQETNALEQTTSKTFDENYGYVSSSTDLNGLVTNYSYDTFDRLSSIVYPNQVQTSISFAWENSGDPQGTAYSETKQTSGSPKTITYFDKLDRVIAVATEGFDSKIIMQTTQYDELGRICEESFPYFIGDKVYYTSYQYDILGRIFKTMKPDGSTTTVTYNGLQTTSTNPLNQTLTEIKNVRGKVVKTIDDMGNITLFTYDSFDNLIQTEDSAKNITTMTYDLLGRKTEMVDPDKGQWSYTYNVLGQLVSQTDAMSQTTTFKYDLLGRIISRQDPTGTSTWEYDTAQYGIGLLAKIESQVDTSVTSDDIVQHTDTYQYNDLSLLSCQTTVTDGNSYSSKTTYDTYNRPLIMTYSSGVQVLNTYDSRGTLTKISDVSTEQVYWTLNDMDAFGRITSSSHGKNLTTTHTFDPKTIFLTKIETNSDINAIIESLKKYGTTNQAQTLQSINYHYDALGNLTIREDSINGIDEYFTYDDLNRLTTYTSNSDKITYQYDNIGNITYKSDIGHYTYGENGAGPHAVTSISGNMTATYTYNANGEQTKGTINGSNRSIDYTSFSKPKNIVTDNGSVQFYYDANRNRFKRIDSNNNGTTTTLYLNDLDFVTYGDGTVQQRHYIGPYSLLILDKEENRTTYETLKDYQNSTTAIVDGSNDVLQRFHYTPFGKQSQIAGHAPAYPITNRGYTNHEEISSADIIHMNGRIYDPVIARFLSADPLAQDPMFSQSLNRYSYCINNPMSFTDPSGFGWFKKMWKKGKRGVRSIGRGIRKITHMPVIGTILQVAVMGISLITQQYWLAAAYSAISSGSKGAGIFDYVKAFGASYLMSMGGGSGNFLDSALGKLKSIGQGLISGAIQSLQGKSFSDGFLASTVSQLLGGKVTSLMKNRNIIAGLLVRSATAGVIGGTIAEVHGGKFTKAAVTSSFSRLLYDASNAISSLMVSVSEKLSSISGRISNARKSFDTFMGKIGYVSGLMGKYLMCKVTAFTDSKINPVIEKLNFLSSMGNYIGGIFRISKEPVISFGVPLQGVWDRRINVKYGFAIDKITWTKKNTAQVDASWQYKEYGWSRITF